MQLEEKIQIQYNRITLVNKNFRERITIDTNLNFSSPSDECSLNNLAIVEIKREENRQSSPLESNLKELGIHPFSISKYCLGISQLYSGVKKNLINIKIREINKMLEEYDSQLQKKII